MKNNSGNQGMIGQFRGEVIILFNFNVFITFDCSILLLKYLKLPIFCQIWKYENIFFTQQIETGSATIGITTVTKSSNTLLQAILNIIFEQIDNNILSSKIQSPNGQFKFLCQQIHLAQTHFISQIKNLNWIQFKYINQKTEKMATDERSSKKLSVNELMYNIESKLSLLSQIQQKGEQSKKKVEQKLSILYPKGQEKKNSEQIDLPMQILNKKMQQIMNEKSSQKVKDREQSQKNERTFQKKRILVHQLQTGTRNIEDIKKQLMKSSSKFPPPNNKQVRQFMTSPAQQQPMTQSHIMSASQSSSRIVSKFNQIQINYAQKIKSLTFKVSFLQQKLTQSQEHIRELLSSLETYKSLYERKEDDINKQVERRLQQVKDQLIDRFAEECRMKYNEYVEDLKQVNQMLSQEKKKRTFFQEQNKVLKMQKQHIDFMYKNLLNKQKLALKVDIDQTRLQLNSQLQLEKNSYIQIQQSGLNNNYHQSNIGTHAKGQRQDLSEIQKRNCSDTDLLNQQNIIYNSKSNYHMNMIDGNLNDQKLVNKKSKSRSKDKSFEKNKDKSLSLSKKSQKSQSKSKHSRNLTENENLKNSAIKKIQKTSLKSQVQVQSPSQMSKQDLIPFLAKGIQQLKQRLKMK